MVSKTSAHLPCLMLPVSVLQRHLDFFSAKHREKLIQTLLPIQLILIPCHLQVDVLEEGPQVCRALHSIQSISQPSLNQHVELTHVASRTSRTL